MTSVLLSDRGRSYSDISAVILAGGRARRLGGVDKGLIKLAGKPLISHVLGTLTPCVHEVFISANRHQTEYSALHSATVVSDESADYAGPLAGILSAMRICQTPLLLVAPCDAPATPEGLVAKLHSAFIERQVDICVAHDGERLQPLFALLKCELQDDLANWLSNDQHKVKEWYQTHTMAAVDFQDASTGFVNLNTWSAVKAFERGS